MSFNNADGRLRGAKLLETIHFIIDLSIISFLSSNIILRETGRLCLLHKIVNLAAGLLYPVIKKFLTLFLCTNKHIKTKTFFNNDTRRSYLSTSKLICDKGWILVGHKCLYFIIFNTSVSFNKAQLQCASYESKHLSIEKVVSPYQYEYNFHFKLASIVVRN